MLIRTLPAGLVNSRVCIVFFCVTRTWHAARKHGKSVPTADHLGRAAWADALLRLAGAEAVGSILRAMWRSVRYSGRCDLGRFVEPQSARRWSRPKRQKVCWQDRLLHP